MSTSDNIQSESRDTQQNATSELDYSSSEDERPNATSELDYSSPEDERPNWLNDNPRSSPLGDLFSSFKLPSFPTLKELLKDDYQRYIDALDAFKEIPKLVTEMSRLNENLSRLDSLTSDKSETQQKGPVRKRMSPRESNQLAQEFVELYISDSTDPDAFITRSDMVKQFNRYKKLKGGLNETAKVKFLYPILNARFGNKNEGKLIDGKKIKGWKKVSVRTVSLPDHIIAAAVPLPDVDDSD